MKWGIMVLQSEQCCPLTDKGNSTHPCKMQFTHSSASLLWPNFPDPAFNVYLFLAKLWLLPAEICAHCHIHITSSQLLVYLGIDSILSTLFKVLTALCIYPFAIVIWQSVLYN